jgi:hypothetical protein
MRGVVPSFRFAISVDASQKKLILALRKLKTHFSWDKMKIGLCGIPCHPKGNARVRYGLVLTNYAIIKFKSSSFNLKAMQTRMW